MACRLYGIGCFSVVVSSGVETIEANRAEVALLFPVWKCVAPGLALTGYDFAGPGAQRLGSASVWHWMKRWSRTPAPLGRHRPTDAYRSRNVRRVIRQRTCAARAACAVTTLRTLPASEPPNKLVDFTRWVVAKKWAQALPTSPLVFAELPVPAARAAGGLSSATARTAASPDLCRLVCQQEASGTVHDGGGKTASRMAWRRGSAWRQDAAAKRSQTHTVQ